MLNRAARYFPILRLLKPYLRDDSRVLEIGSGARGITEFRPRPTVGCDIAFHERVRTHLTPVVASAAQLPFQDQSFDFVIGSDVLEHIPANQRSSVIAEALRVAREGVVFAFPSGPDAQETDRELLREYERCGSEVPSWLAEHMREPFPTSKLFAELPRGWRAETYPNELLRFHSWMTKREMSRVWRFAFKLAIVIVPGLVGYLLSRADAVPCYRQIVVLRRTETASASVTKQPEFLNSPDEPGRRSACQ